MQSPDKFSDTFPSKPSRQNIDTSRRRALLVAAAAAGAAVVPSSIQAAQATKRKSLPKAETSGGKPLLEALAARKTTRALTDKVISEQHLANILWAAWGENRPSGMRTAPSAMNRQDAVLYVALEDGVWEYNAARHELGQVLPDNYLSLFGDTPLALLYAATDGQEDGAMLVGSMYQNVGLYCASANIGNVVKTNVCEVLERRLPLPKGYKVYIVHSIGWPI